MKLFGGFLWVLAGCVCLTLAKDGPLVETKLGKVRGSYMVSSKGRQFSAFRGIRYAQAPVGELRFKPPVAVTTWGDGVLDATKNGHICPQRDFVKIAMSEDCLVLNVYSGDLNGNESVLVYVHGGGNIFCSSHSELMIGPKFLMDRKIVVVSMNYRYGSLGFLSTGTKEAPGNYGYLDQQMVLQWVKDHISSFGGNPDSVTLFGMSAGAMAVTLHMVSPLSAGLFHRAIVMSGAITNHLQFDNVALTRRLAREFSCPLYKPAAVVDCLRQIEWKTIIKYFYTWELYDIPNSVWSYEIDGYFLLDTPTNLFANGSFTKVPVITGTTRDEQAFLAYHFDERVLDDINENFDEYIPDLLKFDLEPDYIKREKAQRIRRFYLNNSRVDEQLANFGNLFSDGLIGHGVFRFMELARKHVDVFYYRNDYLGRFGRNVDLNIVGHGEDLQYIFDSDFYGGRIQVGDPEWFMVERLTEWWTSFARDGAPSDLDGIKWLPSNSSSVFALYNDKNVTLSQGTSYNFDRYSLWDSLFPLPHRNSIVEASTALLLTAGAAALHVCAKIVL